MLISVHVFEASQRAVINTDQIAYVVPEGDRLTVIFVGDERKLQITNLTYDQFVKKVKVLDLIS